MKFIVIDKIRNRSCSLPSATLGINDEWDSVNFYHNNGKTNSAVVDRDWKERERSRGKIAANRLYFSTYSFIYVYFFHVY